ncbi:MAG: hypothetical protein IPN84_01535 [Sphingomonadales bacterium]|nr:hypothetical protein [Sphingomonadales bacterium]
MSEKSILPAICWLLPDAAERRKRVPRMFRAGADLIVSAQRWAGRRH